MKKLSYFLIIIFALLLNSCSSTNTERTTIPSSPASDAAAADGGTSFEKLEIAKIAFKDIAAEKSAEYTDRKFLREFQSFIANQGYTPANIQWEEGFTASLADAAGNTLLGISMGNRSVTFDRDVMIKGCLFSKGKTYETEQWIDEYLGQFAAGSVMNPVYLNFPAKIRLPDGDYRGELVNEGNRTVNLYETMNGLQTFINTYLAGRDFEIAGGERLFSFEVMQAEEAKQGRARVISVTYDSNDPKMYISSSNNYIEYAGGSWFSLYRDDEAPGIYRLAVYGEVLCLKVDDAFDRVFQGLFDDDAQAQVQLKAADVEELFKQKKPMFLEYLCKNLGLTPWNFRDDDKLEKSVIKLETGAKYTVLAVKNPFNVSVMLFNGVSGDYTGCLEFGGRAAGTDYTVERAGGHTWIAGNKCHGYGTGIHIYNREWYLLDDKGARLVLSIPYDECEVGPYGGYFTATDDIRFIKGDTVKVEADYSLTRVYVLNIDEADEYGEVNVEVKKKAEFVWNEAFQSFTSEYPTLPETNELPSQHISPQGPELSKKCAVLLEKNYDRLKSGIEALDSPENEPNRRYKAGAYEEFLKDCPDSAKKAALLELLKEKSPSDQN